MGNFQLTLCYMQRKEAPLLKPCFHFEYIYFKFAKYLHLDFVFVIFQIKPLSGPIEGGTLVTIEGSDLGLKEEDVRGKIHIGHMPCELQDYQVKNHL